MPRNDRRADRDSSRARSDGLGRRRRRVPAGSRSGDGEPRAASSSCADPGHPTRFRPRPGHDSRPGPSRSSRNRFRSSPLAQPRSSPLSADDPVTPDDDRERDCDRSAWPTFLARFRSRRGLPRPARRTSSSRRTAARAAAPRHAPRTGFRASSMGRHRRSCGSRAGTARSSPAALGQDGVRRELGARSELRPTGRCQWPWEIDADQSWSRPVMTRVSSPSSGVSRMAWRTNIAVSLARLRCRTETRPNRRT